jgi:hypothetical protein
LQYDFYAIDVYTSIGFAYACQALVVAGMAQHTVARRQAGSLCLRVGV